MRGFLQFVGFPKREGFQTKVENRGIAGNLQQSSGTIGDHDRKIGDTYSIAVSGSLNRWLVIYNHPIGRKHTTYIPLIYIANWMIIWYLPPIKGTRKLH